MVMAAEVGSVVRLLRGEKEKEKGEDAEGRGRGLVTRDLLGGCDDRIETKELDLDLEVPLGWEKRLDLVSGEVYFHQSSTEAARLSPPPHLRKKNLNFPSLSAYPPPNLDLKLSPSLYQSVCTLDDVRSALHRLESAAASKAKTSPASSPSSSATSSSSSFSSSEVEENGGGGLVATGCPSCLSYVLVLEGRRRCPRCRADIDVSVGKKRRRSAGVDLDLNLGRAGAQGGNLRPTKPLGWWGHGSRKILGGRDVQAEGTWMGCTRDGKLAFQTNVMESDAIPTSKIRGDLPVKFLEIGKNPIEFAVEVIKEADQYNGLNLILADLTSKSMIYISNRPKGAPILIQVVAPGLHVLTNARFGHTLARGMSCDTI